MSLQGSLETVGLADVLTLLANTAKSGELEVSGERRSGRLWFKEGKLSGFSVSGAPTAVDALFQLMRVSTGTFSFNDNRSAPSPVPPVVVDNLVAEAKDRLAEWRTIEVVVPSLEAMVELVTDTTGEVILDQDQWKLVVAIGDGRPVGAVLERRKLAEFDGCKAIKGLVDSTLARVAPKPAPAPVRSAVAPAAATPAGRLPQRPLSGAPGAGGNGSGGTAPVGSASPPAKETPATESPAQGSSSVGARPLAPSGSSAGAPTAGKSAEPPTASKPGAEVAEKKIPAGVGAGQATANATKPSASSSASVPGPAAQPAVAGPSSVPDAAKSPEAKADRPSEAKPETALGKEKDGAPLEAKASAASAPGEPGKAEPAPAAMDGDGVSESGDELDSDGEPLNRGLLLKFLSSVRS